ncbi:hypothetical protein pb186bvf_018286 [Paramecium bursaria]
MKLLFMNSRCCLSSRNFIKQILIKIIKYAIYIMIKNDKIFMINNLIFNNQLIYISISKGSTL